MLKSTLTAILLSSVALVPAATVAVVATADVAHAKSDKAGGNGNGGGNGNKGGSSSSAKTKSSKSKATSNGGAGKSASRRSGTDPISSVIRKLTGQSKKTTAKVKTRTAAPKVAKAAPAREKGPMHPSNLGNMNGALNANTNALLAHIRNGNTNGPVGVLAALAVANVNAEGADETLTIEENYEALENLLGDQTIEDYLANRNGTGEDPAVEEALSNLDGLTEEDEGYEDAVTALETALGDRTLAEYEEARDGTGGDPEVDAALAAVGGDAEAGTAPTIDRPTEEQVAEAAADMEAQSGAEESVLSYWNKRPDADPDADQMLLEKLNERLTAENEAIKDAMGFEEEPIEAAEELEELDDTAGCTLEEGCDEGANEEVVAAAE